MTPNPQPAGGGAGPRRHLPEAVYLVYLVFLVFEPIFDPTTRTRDWLLIAPMVAAFVPLYFWTVRRVGRAPYVWSREGRRLGGIAGIGGIVLLGLVCTPLNSGASAFFIYAAAAAGRLRPRRRAMTTLGAVVLAVVVAAVTSPVGFPYVLAAFAPVAIFVPILGLTAIFERDRAQANARLAMAQDEIERLAAIAERERIGRDLHDLLGHTLSTITLKSELAARLAERDPERAGSEMREVERISRDALAQVREAVRGYRGRGLAGEVAGAKLALEAAGVAYDYYLETVELPATHESVLALALREAITNVVRHAGATHCVVRLERDGGAVVLRVRDDGVGGADGEGNGLSSMRARIQTVGGTLRLEPLDPGTELSVTVPLGARRSAARTAAPGGTVPEAGT